VVVAGSSVSAAFGQVEADTVHIQPRPQSSRRLNSVDSFSLGSNAGIIRKNVELVLVPVTVTDFSNRLITGLDKSNFTLYENKQQQEIKHFGSEDSPVSLGIVLDVSGSMQTKIERARDAIVELLRTSNPQDEFFLITFADQPILAHDFTHDPEKIQSGLLFISPKGRTSLLDAIYMGIAKMRQAKYQRRALVIISDGGDNRSRYSEHDVKTMVKEADVLVYSIGVFDKEFQTMEEKVGPALLSEMSDATGATSYVLDNPNYLPKIAERIGSELRNQYLLGFRPADSKCDGKWRKIKVKLQAPRGMHLHVQARSGYYGPRADSERNDF
jgi:Ca-activated chloride channel family protein